MNENLNQWIPAFAGMTVLLYYGAWAESSTDEPCSGRCSRNAERTLWTCRSNSSML